MTEKEPPFILVFDAVSPKEGLVLDEESQRAEQILARLALTRTDVRAQAARALSLTPNTFRSKIIRWGWRVQLPELNELLSAGQVKIRVPEQLPLNRKIDFYAEITNFEWQLIQAALTKTGGNQACAAPLLALLPTTLNSRIKALRLLKEVQRMKLESSLDYRLGVADRRQRRWQSFKATNNGLRRDVNTYCEDLVYAALEEAKGNITRAAQLLRLEPGELRELIHKTEE